MAQLSKVSAFVQVGYTSGPGPPLPLIINHTWACSQDDKSFQSLDSDKAPIVAVLATIGGLDDRPRLGGLVTSEEWGTGTVSKIQTNGKVTVQGHEERGTHVCRISELSCVSSCHLDLLLRDCCSYMSLSIAPRACIYAGQVPHE